MTDIETLRWTVENILPAQQSDWLHKGMKILRVDFEQIGETLPQVIWIVVDYPDGEDSDSSWLGRYTSRVFTDGPPESSLHCIHINPTVDGLMALDILVHELVHAVTPDDEGDHGERFMEVATAIGLDADGPIAAAEGVLLKRLKDIQEILGSYPIEYEKHES